MTHGFDLDGHGPHAYERLLVPALFTGCADRLVDLARPATGRPRAGRRVRHRDRGAVGGPPAELGGLAGADVNEAMLDVARSVPDPGCDVGVEWHEADAAALPFADASFDLVYCQQGLQYLGDPSAGLREMSRVLAPGGRMALAVWRSINNNPGFASLVGALERHAAPEAAQ